MRSERYQIALITLGLAVTALFGYFVYQEMFPEYRIYQNDYVALEEFRSTYSGEPPPAFKEGVKQVVFEREDRGPARIDRCVSCHVALELPHFSPTKISHDVNGNIVRTANGTPMQEPNENYVWARLDQKIAELRDEKVNAQLKQNGESGAVDKRLKEAKSFEALKVAYVDEHVYDVTKVLRMHPLIGKETRPFEFHPIEEYGCVSCHSGNGRGLTTSTAHGPVFDGQYEEEYMGPAPQFLEHDPENDPQFARVFNHKPDDSLLFQTTPILVGNLIQSSCVKCHEQSAVALLGVANTTGVLAKQKSKSVDYIQQGFMNEMQALLSLYKLKGMVNSEGVDHTIAQLKQTQADPATLPLEHEHVTGQLAFLQNVRGINPNTTKERVLAAIDQCMVGMLGTQTLVESISAELAKTDDPQNTISKFLADNVHTAGAEGTLFVKREVANLQQALLEHVEATQRSVTNVVDDESVVSAMTNDVDWLTKNYHRGEQLYISQGCYACHRISGLSHGGVGPELTRIGEGYPWYIKNKIMWPQGDLRTSTMPNLVLDTTEMEDLMTFLLAQKGRPQSISETDYKVALQQWEAGRKLPFEKPVTPSQIQDLRFSMTVFATEGCAACHRLQGYESNVGYSIEKGEKPSFDTLYAERQWFQTLFPEEIRGSKLVEVIEKYAQEIDQRISDDVRQGALLEEIEQKFPDSIEAFYANFRYASRAKDHQSAQHATQPPGIANKIEAQNQLEIWKKRVHRVLMMYVQEYGLGRLIGPRPNWSGVYHSDEWLLEHFHNPTGHVPRSIMPILPFDETKFYALTYMLDVLGKRNRDAVRAIWEHKGFDPALAFHIHCAQCHGDYLQGNGPVSTWIYPIPKNLRNAEFLRNLTRENEIQSIMHGVKGTPMGPWGEVPEDKMNYDGIPVLTIDEITKLVDWLFTSLPGGTVIRGHQDVPKWNYMPSDVIEELHREGTELKEGDYFQDYESGLLPGKKKTPLGAAQEALDKAAHYYAALDPIVYVAQNAALKTFDDKVNDVFDVKPNPQLGGEKYLYYIKKKYYTENNVEQGKKFFELNCAVCHGADADGSGVRASVMADAKPRMLTNLDWIHTRDDLRLLRSIKYGVPGTAMTPWGDFTSSLQRLQLVMFIRSLSIEKAAREAVSEELYKSFDKGILQVENARIAEYKALDTAQRNFEDLHKKQKAAYAAAQVNMKEISEATTLYQRQLLAEEELRQYKALDQVLLDLKEQIAAEREIYQGIASDMLTANLEEQPEWQILLKMIDLNGSRITYTDGKLIINNDDKIKLELTNYAKQLSNSLDVKIDALTKLQEESGKAPNFSENETQQKKLRAQKIAYNKIKSKVLTGMEQISLFWQQENKLLTDYQKQKEQLKLAREAKTLMLS